LREALDPPSGDHVVANRTQPEFDFSSTESPFQSTLGSPDQLTLICRVDKKHLSVNVWVVTRDATIGIVQEELGQRLRERYFALAESAIPTSEGNIVRLPQPEATELWNAFILEGDVATKARHGMLLGPEYWPCTRLSERIPISLPLPARFSMARLWLVFWMRERAAVVAGKNLEASLDALLREDDEAVIAIDLDSRDSLQSWGGHGDWFTLLRPR
jgi:hypothetical protein